MDTFLVYINYLIPFLFLLLHCSPIFFQRATCVPGILEAQSLELLLSSSKMSGESLKFLILEATAMSGEPSATGLPPPSPATTATASFVDRNEFFSEGQIFYADASFNDSVVVNVQTTGGGYGLKPNREELRHTCQRLFRKSENFTFAEMYTVMMHSSPVQTLTGQSGKFFLKYIRDLLQNPEFCNTEDGKLATLAVQLQTQVWVRSNNSGSARPATLEYLWPEMKEDGTAPVTWIMWGVFDGYSGTFRLCGTLDELINSLEHGK